VQPEQLGGRANAGKNGIKQDRILREAKLGRWAGNLLILFAGYKKAKDQG